MSLETMERSAAQETSVEKLEKVGDQLSAYLERLGIPVTTNCRVKMEAFNIYPEEEVKMDILRYRTNPDEKRDFREEIFKRVKPDKGPQLKIEQFELYMNLLLHKFLKDEFIVVRASEYDDYREDIDKLIISRETGEVICAIDTIAEGTALEGAQKRVNEQNQNGVRLKYSFQLSGEGDTATFLPKSSRDIKVIPSLYLALPSDRVYRGVNGLSGDLNTISAEDMINFAGLTMLAEKELGEMRKAKLPEHTMNSLEKFLKILKNSMESLTARAQNSIA